jgi:hypothetical protein
LLKNLKKNLFGFIFSHREKTFSLQEKALVARALFGFIFSHREKTRAQNKYLKIKNLC